MLEYSFFAEKLRWESINVDGADDQMPKPRAGHSAVNVNIFSVLLYYQCGRLLIYINAFTPRFQICPLGLQDS